MLSGATRVLAQLITFDQQGIFAFDLFAGRVVRVAVIHADRARNAILRALGAPTATERAEGRNKKAPIGRRNAMQIGGDEIGVMSGNDTIRNGRRERLKYGIY